MADHYETLGVNPTASASEIKAAYRNKARLYHPDVNGGSAEAETKFKQINEAWDVLKNPGTKTAYDLERAAPQFNRNSPPPRSGPTVSPLKVLLLQERISNILDSFNDYLQRKATIRDHVKEAESDFKRKYSGLRHIFWRRSYNIEERTKAQGYLDILSDKKIAQDEQLSANILKLHKSIMTALERGYINYNETLDGLDKMEKQVSIRHRLIDDSLDVISGRADTLRCRLKLNTGPS